MPSLEQVAANFAAAGRTARAKPAEKAPRTNYLSDHANNLSRDAHESNRVQDHRAAMDAYRKAAKFHQTDNKLFNHHESQRIKHARLIGYDDTRHNGY